jgi:hypothetical protein
MILERNGESYAVNLHSKKVNIKLPIKNKSVGGDSSATDTVNAGTKAKTITVAGLIKFDDKSILEEITQLAEKVEEDGSRSIYSITHDAANAMRVRQVYFDGDLDVREAQDVKAWNITFSLKQYNSVAEATEAKNTNTSAVVQDSVTGEEIAAPEIEEEQAINANGTVYKMLKKLDDLLAPTNETT